MPVLELALWMVQVSVRSQLKYDKDYGGPDFPYENGMITCLVCKFVFHFDDRLAEEWVLYPQSV